MKENFSHRYIHNLKSQSATGKIVNITIFSEYRSDKAALKVKNIYDLLSNPLFKSQSLYNMIRLNYRKMIS